MLITVKHNTHLLDEVVNNLKVKKTAVRSEMEVERFYQAINVFFLNLSVLLLGSLESVSNISRECN